MCWKKKRILKEKNFYFLYHLFVKYRLRDKEDIYENMNSQLNLPRSGVISLTLGETQGKKERQTHSPERVE